MTRKEDWQWYGQAAHFICGRWCRFHLATLVGPWVISTVGEYVHPRQSQGSERIESEWLQKNWPGEDIGYQRKYETMVFRSVGICNDSDCDCGLPTIDGHELDSAGCNTAKEARANHLEMCEKWSKVEASEIGREP